MANLSDLRLAELYDEHQDKLTSYLLSLRVPEGSIDVVTQDTWMRVWRYWESFNPTRPFVPWLFGLARHEMLSHRRWMMRDKRRIEVDMTSALITADFEDDADAHQLQSDWMHRRSFIDEDRILLRLSVEKLMDKTLKGVQYERLYKYFFEDKDCTMIARESGCNKISAWRAIERAKKNLKKEFENDLI